MLSAAYGLMEQWVFFVFLFPTLFIILHKHVTKNYWLSFIVAAFIIAFVFTGYHIFRYAANDQALMSVFIFSWFNTIPMVIFKSTIVGDSLHATNNFVASIREVQRVGWSLGVLG
jgi:general stress protein CsbA